MKRRENTYEIIFTFLKKVKEKPALLLQMNCLNNINQPIHLIPASEILFHQVVFLFRQF
jgi:hypothetical protein